MRRSQNGDWYAAKTLPKESLTYFSILSQYFSILAKIPQNAQKISVKTMNIPARKFKIRMSEKRCCVRASVWTIYTSFFSYSFFTTNTCNAV